VTYRWVEHTAELELEIEAAAEEEVFADALAALEELLGPASGPEARREIAVGGADRPVLLAAWLEELVFLAEMERFVPERLESIELDAGGLRAAVAGRLGAPPHLVKAVTYHRLELRLDNGGWRARVVLDV
jgi:SHS2 domain-containing protein